MRVQWEVSDGYTGGSRPHTVIIDDDELRACDNDEERHGLVLEYVQDAFEQRVSYSIIGELDFSNLQNTDEEE